MAQYTTGELAKLAGVTVRTVQFYDSKDLLKPSGVTEGGRRLYSEADLATMRTIVFLKDLGFSLGDIASILYEDDSRGILAMLLADQEAELRTRIDEERARLDGLRELKRQLKHMDSLNRGSLGAMVTLMGNRKKLRNLRLKTLPVGLLMDVLWIGTLIYGILTGVWWPFPVGLAATIALGVLITRYYCHHVAYVCPEDQTIFRPPIRKMFFAYHTPSTRKLTCPVCGYTGLCLEVYVPDSRPLNVDGTLIWREGGDGAEGNGGAAKDGVGKRKPLGIATEAGEGGDRR